MVRKSSGFRQHVVQVHENKKKAEEYRKKIPPVNIGNCDICGQVGHHLVDGICMHCSKGDWKW